MYIRRDDWITDATGAAQPGTLVYYCLQPADTSGATPTPLANVYTDATGETAAPNPQTADGYGHTSVYLAEGQYTIVYQNSLIGQQVLTDQTVAASGTVQRTAVSDANYAALATDWLIAYTALTASRTVTLPAPSAAQAGKLYVVKDESGNAGTYPIVVTAPVSIDGSSSVQVNGPYGSVAVYSDGAAYFTFAAKTGTAPAGNAGGGLAGQYPNPTLAGLVTPYAVPYDGGSGKLNEAAPPTSQGTYVLAESPTSTSGPVAPAFLNLGSYLASPPAIGETSPGQGTFLAVTLTQGAPPAAAGQVALGSTTATTATAGTETLPANPAGFLEFSMDATTYKIPYYNN